MPVFAANVSVLTEQNVVRVHGMRMVGAVGARDLDQDPHRYDLADHVSFSWPPASSALRRVRLSAYRQPAIKVQTMQVSKSVPVRPSCSALVHGLHKVASASLVLGSFFLPIFGSDHDGSVVARGIIGRAVCSTVSSSPSSK